MEKSEEQRSGTRPHRNAARVRENLRFAHRVISPTLPIRLADSLKTLSHDFDFSLRRGDLQILNNSWYVTHTGLFGWRVARGAAVSMSRPSIRCVIPRPVVSSSRRRCIRPKIPPDSSATAMPTLPTFLCWSAAPRCGSPRPEPSIALCVRLMASESARSRRSDPIPVRWRRLLMHRSFRPKSANGNGNGSGHKVRDRLCQIIRQHKLDPELVKAYAVDFCGTKALKDATREQVESFVQQLAEAAKKDRGALLCQLNSYAPPSQEVAG